MTGQRVTMFIDVLLGMALFFLVLLVTVACKPGPPAAEDPAKEQVHPWVMLELTLKRKATQTPAGGPQADQWRVLAPCFLPRQDKGVLLQTMPADDDQVSLVYFVPQQRERRVPVVTAYSVGEYDWTRDFDVVQFRLSGERGVHAPPQDRPITVDDVRSSLDSSYAGQSAVSSVKLKLEPRRAASPAAAANSK